MTSTLRDLLLAGEFDGEQYDEFVETCGPQDWPGLLELGSHPDGAVRRALVSTLPHLCDPPPPSWVELVIELTADPEARVRDWACFTLSEQWREVDTPAVRQALADRLDDADHEVRCGALVGLAYRRDARALPRVRGCWAEPRPGLRTGKSRTTSVRDFLHLGGPPQGCSQPAMAISTA